MGREGIQKVAVLVESGIAEDAQQFIPLRALLNGNVGANKVIESTLTIGGSGTGVLVSAVLDNPNNTGIHLLLILDNDSGSFTDMKIQIFSAPSGLLPSLIREFAPFDPFLLGAFVFDLHRALTDDTNDIRLQRLSGLLTQSYEIAVVATGTTGATIEVELHTGLIV